MRGLILSALLLVAPPALGADVWQQVDTNPGAYWVAASGGRQLEVHCNMTEGYPSLMMVLFGGEQPLPPQVESEGELVLAVTLWPSALTDAVVGSWLGPFDNAVNGDFPSNEAFLNEFVRADRLEIKGPEGVTLFDAPLTGAKWARFGFGEVCGV